MSDLTGTVSGESAGGREDHLEAVNVAKPPPPSRPGVTVVSAAGTHFITSSPRGRKRKHRQFAAGSPAPAPSSSSSSAPAANAPQAAKEKPATTVTATVLTTATSTTVTADRTTATTTVTTASVTRAAGAVAPGLRSPAPLNGRRAVQVAAVAPPAVSPSSLMSPGAVGRRGGPKKARSISPKKPRNLSRSFASPPAPSSTATPPAATTPPSLARRRLSVSSSSASTIQHHAPPLSSISAGGRRPSWRRDSDGGSGHDGSLSYGSRAPPESLVDLFSPFGHNPPHVGGTGHSPSRASSQGAGSAGPGDLPPRPRRSPRHRLRRSVSDFGVASTAATTGAADHRSRQPVGASRTAGARDHGPGAATTGLPRADDHDHHEDDDDDDDSEPGANRRRRRHYRRLASSEMLETEAESLRWQSSAASAAAQRQPSTVLRSDLFADHSLDEDNVGDGAGAPSSDVLDVAADSPAVTTAAGSAPGGPAHGAPAAAVSRTEGDSIRRRADGTADDADQGPGHQYVLSGGAADLEGRTATEALPTIVARCEATETEQDQAFEEEDDEEDDDEEEEPFDPFYFMKCLPPRPADVVAALSPQLPPRANAFGDRATLVLDLDETLVHCSTTQLPGGADLHFPVMFNDVEYKVFVRRRPQMAQFLRAVAAHFEVVVFTASQRVYADRLLDILDPDGDLIHHRLFRDSCICVEGNFLKDLTVLGRELERVAIVDNSPQVFGYQLDNGVPIETWFDDDTDDELMRLLPFLRSLATAKDVRPLIRERFKLHEVVANSQPYMSPSP